MTALKEYERLEASGLWRPGPEEQRREVVLSIGEATLTISDMRDRPLAHWSLAALDRLNPGTLPAIYAPDGDPGETLEIAENETDMVAAIEKLRLAIERARPRPGRLRMASTLTVIVVVAAALLLWLPGALTRHAVNVVPQIQRQAIGLSLLGRIERVAGRACASTDTAPVLARLARRTKVRKLVVLRTGLADARHLPGGIVLLNKALIEDFEDPAVVAGYILAERTRAQGADPLAALLRASGPFATFQLLTTGKLSRESLDNYGETVLVAPAAPLPDAPLLQAFAATAVPSTPYAYARDITGESVLPLIEADPMAGQSPAPVLSDRDWVLLQSICGG
ncbi:hypothetical protein [Sedimentitalea nanhaiensis]|uniref:Uncharacterized protein n=1 Tax=Sedimentitalea nanhaiensis TaxID=999627 RepID=A0A1I7B1J2_9RHOB|nr:hypothetical protein [Sedimentitalea nanhaiensis]SFT81066.1 hypothetical protein SAMN05216236_10880 [Sedimentitalea nanhaiensis]